jgi:ankyrin repeat protein
MRRLSNFGQSRKQIEQLCNLPVKGDDSATAVARKLEEHSKRQAMAKAKAREAPQQRRRSLFALMSSKKNTPVQPENAKHSTPSALRKSQQKVSPTGTSEQGDDGPQTDTPSPALAMSPKEHRMKQWEQEQATRIKAEAELMNASTTAAMDELLAKKAAAAAKKAEADRIQAVIDDRIERQCNAFDMLASKEEYERFADNEPPKSLYTYNKAPEQVLKEYMTKQRGKNTQNDLMDDAYREERRSEAVDTPRKEKMRRKNSAAQRKQARPINLHVKAGDIVEFGNNDQRGVVLGVYIEERRASVEVSGQVGVVKTLMFDELRVILSCGGTQDTSKPGFGVENFPEHLALMRNEPAPGERVVTSGMRSSHTLQDPDPLSTEQPVEVQIREALEARGEKRPHPHEMKDTGKYISECVGSMTLAKEALVYDEVLADRAAYKPRSRRNPHVEHACDLPVEHTHDRPGGRTYAGNVDGSHNTVPTVLRPGTASSRPGTASSRPGTAIGGAWGTTADSGGINQAEGGPESNDDDSEYGAEGSGLEDDPGCRPQVGSMLHLGNIMLKAAKQNDLEAIQRALSAGGDINYCNSLGETPLGLAARFGHLQIAKYLLSPDCMPWASPNVLATSHSHHNPKAGMTPLMEAAAYGRIEILTLMLKGGLQENMMKDFTKAERDQRRVRDKKYKVYVYGTNPNVTTAKGLTALMIAALRQQWEAMDVLGRAMYCDADLQEYNQGWTALHYCVHAGEEALPGMESLAKAGADFLIPDFTKRTPSDVAKEKKVPSVMVFLKRVPASGKLSNDIERNQNPFLDLDDRMWCQAPHTPRVNGVKIIDEEKGTSMRVQIDAMEEKRKMRAFNEPQKYGTYVTRKDCEVLRKQAKEMERENKKKKKEKVKKREQEILLRQQYKGLRMAAAKGEDVSRQLDQLDSGSAPLKIDPVDVVGSEEHMRELKRQTRGSFRGVDSAMGETANRLSAVAKQQDRKQRHHATKKNRDSKKIKKIKMPYSQSRGETVGQDKENAQAGTVADGSAPHLYAAYPHPYAKHTPAGPSIVTPKLLTEKSDKRRVEPVGELLNGPKMGMRGPTLKGPAKKGPTLKKKPRPASAVQKMKKGMAWG